MTTVLEHQLRASVALNYLQRRVSAPMEHEPMLDRPLILAITAILNYLTAQEDETTIKTGIK